MVANVGLSVRDTTDDGKVSTAGEFFIEKLSLVNYKGESVDLSEIYEEFNIYEDMWRNFISGNLLIKDANNLYKNFPIIGQEYLIIKVGSRPHDGKYLELVYRVYGSSEVGQNKEGVYLYSLNFCSPEMEKNQYSRIAETYENTAEEIVGKILGEVGDRSSDQLGLDKDKKYLNWEYSNGTVMVISPSNKNPAETINMICSKTVAEDGIGCTFVFYETMQGAFNFLCVENMLKTKPVKSYIVKQADVWEQEVERRRDIVGDLKRVEEFSIERPMNVMQARMSGMLGSRSMIINIAKKKVDTYEYDYFEDFEKRIDNKLEGRSSVPLYLPVKDLQTEKLPNVFKNARFNVSFDSSYIHDNNSGFDSKMVVPRRESVMNQFSNFKIHIKVSGDVFRQVGEVINLTVPSVESDEDGNQRADSKLSGKYLITAIKHTFGRTDYKMTMEIVKDSFNKGFLDEQ